MRCSPGLALGGGESCLGRSRSRDPFPQAPTSNDQGMQGTEPGPLPGAHNSKRRSQGSRGVHLPLPLLLPPRGVRPRASLTEPLHLHARPRTHGHTDTQTDGYTHMYTDAHRPRGTRRPTRAHAHTHTRSVILFFSLTKEGKHQLWDLGTDSKTEPCAHGHDYEGPASLPGVI